MNEMLDQFGAYFATGMLGTLAVFVVFGMLFGLGRGLKRASLRLVIFVGLLLVAFFLTPVITSSLATSNITINGQPFDQFVDSTVESMQDSMGNYLKPFAPYLQDYAVGIALAVLNLALFIALYIIVKVVSWFIYAIVAHFAAPKRDRDGNKKKKYAWWGLLVGALQGVLLFVLFMVPINGVIGVVNQAANYQAMQASSEPNPQAAMTQTVESDDSDDENLINALQKFDGAMTTYNNVMRYTGLQFLSNKAFEYQLTVRVDGASSINLVKDINTGLQLYMDAQAFIDVMQKFENAFADGIDLSQLTADDYKIMRRFVSKAFDLQILKVADRLLGDLDQIMNTPFGDDLEYLEGTEIYADSIYGMLIKQNTTEREVECVVVDGEVVPTNYSQYALGLRAVVNYVAEQKLSLIKNDVLSLIDFIETVGTYKITYKGLTQPKTVAEVLAEENLGMPEYLDLATARLAVAQGKYADGTPLINVLGDRLGQFSFVKMLGLPHVDNLITYGKMLEGQFDDNEDLKTLVNDLIPLFLGTNAFNHTDAQNEKVQGNWEKLGEVLLNVADVLRDYVTFGDDVAAIKERLISEKGLDEDTAQIKAVLEYLADLVVTREYYDEHKDEFRDKAYEVAKYQKVDDLAGAIFDLVNAFPPVKKFVISYVEEMFKDDEEGYMQTLVDMLKAEKVEEWYSALHGIVSLANLMNNSALGDLMDKFQNAENIEDLADQFFDALADLDAADVADMLTDILDIPEIGDIVQDALGGILEEVNKEEVLKDIFPDDYAEVQENLDKLQNALEQFGKEGVDQDDLKQELQDAVEGLWGVLEGLLSGADDAVDLAA